MLQPQRMLAKACHVLRALGRFVVNPWRCSTLPLSCLSEIHETIRLQFSLTVELTSLCLHVHRAICAKYELITQFT